jgi:NAD(P)-dependent dehydrogenase (short-subunit alcohol dehydrogenase family)
MGESLAIHFVSKNWLVAVADLQRSPGEALARTLGANATFFETDVASYESQAKTFDAVFRKWGRIDALLANAGIVDKSSIYILNYRNSDRYFSLSAQSDDLRLTIIAFLPHRICYARMWITRELCMERNLRFIL